MATVTPPEESMFPDVQPVMRETGEAFVELRQSGELVGEINISKIVTGIARAFGLLPVPAKATLKSVP